VNAKIFDGQGNHGAEVLYGEDQLPAAPRYIEAKLSESYKKLLLPVLKFVPTFTNDLGNKEYEYLPTPIPFGLTFGYLGIAVGTGCRIPAFTPSSILDAYLHDDPKLLKSAFGLEIANPENLHHLWETGRGRIKYNMKVEQKGNIVSIIGSKGPVEIDWSWFEKMKADGRIEINDLSDTVPRVELELNSRVRYPSVSEIYNNAVAVATAAESYYVRVVYNNQVRDIGLRDWIDITYKNYIRIYELHRKSEISALEYDIKVLTNFRSVADKIINTKDSYEQIAKDLKIDLDIVKTIGSKSINTLRNSDPTKKIPELKNRIESIKKVNVDDVIKNCIELMS
jgi:DNA gyrase/topoisomerase IV subunit A